MTEELTLPLEHITLRALRFGNPEKPPIVALHGWLDNAMSFAPLAPLLCEHRQLIALELAGHGKSGHRPLGAGYGFSDYLYDLYTALDALGLKQCDLLGHSLGAAIATLYAGTFPEKVRHLGAIECYGIPLTSDHFPLPQRLAELLPQYQPANDRPAAVFKDWEKLLAQRLAAGAMKRENAELLLRRNLVRVPEGWIFRSDRRLRLPEALLLDEAQNLAFIARITAPVVVIEGEKGLMPQWPMMPKRYAQTQTIAVHRLSGGHHLHMDYPEAVAAALLASGF